ncbi:MAG: hypothetical protein QGI78_00695 [Phycisphaerales bacterium]|nr:hypothetical protein [Phycisphaerales bacterium]
MAKNNILKTRKANDWKGLRSSVIDLQNANRERVSLAKNGRRVLVVETDSEFDGVKEDGRILIKPPLVGRNASDLQASLDASGYSTIILCREPTTQLGLCPLVTLGDTTTVRTQVEEPVNQAKPTAKWFDASINELGATIVEKTDTFATNDRKLDYLLGHFSAAPTYNGLYSSIIDVCDALLEANG